MAHDHSYLFDCALELFEVDTAFVHDIEVLELFVDELGFIDVLEVLLLDLVLELLVKSAGSK